jgi:ribosomal-protein-alanine N-acetyltransferase
VATTPSLRTNRLLLRPLRPEDRLEFIRVHEVSRPFWEPWTSSDPSGESLDQVFDRRLVDSGRGFEDGTACRLVGFLHDGHIACFFGLSQIFRRTFNNAYIGWSVSAEVARQGYGTEGLTAILDFAFAPEPLGLGLHRLQANIIPENVASLCLAEKVGFRREGLARRYLHIAGAWRDHFMYAKTTEDHRSQYG